MQVMWLAEYSERMHNLKTRIKRRKQNLTRSQNEAVPSSSSTSSSTTSVEGEWQFVNFNPFVYGPKRSSLDSDSGNVSLVRASTTSYHNEDYYEFPTSTKLQGHHHQSQQPEQQLGSHNNNRHSVQVETRNRSGREGRDASKYLRHSLNSAFDLLSQDIPPAIPPPLLTPVKLNPLALPPKRKVPLPVPSASASASEVSSSPNPTVIGSPPLLPSHRPHSWDPDSVTATLVCRDRAQCSSRPTSSHSSGTNNDEKSIPKIVYPPSYLHCHHQRGSSSSHSHSGGSSQPKIHRPPPAIPLTVNNGLHSAGRLSVNLISDKPLSSGAPSSSSLKSNSDRRPDTLSEERLANDGFTYEDGDLARVQQEPRRSSNAVGRSESCKEPVQKKQTRERRKHSDPNLTSKSSDVDLDNQRHLSDANNSGSSSNSSLSARSLDSPSTSLELVGPSYPSSSSLPGRNSETPETTVSHSGALPDSLKSSAGWDGDSDIEIDQDPPDWTKNVPEEKLAALDRLEKKRQEVLNELFHTERSHVRNLKVVDRLFHRPIRQQKLLPMDTINTLFANLEEMLEIHEKFNTALKSKRKENPLVGDIGPVLLDLFEGERGLQFKQTASNFCAKQQIGLELLKDRRRKDAKFNAFLLDAESDQVCRRLQISDMIPMAMQRLTKYPLLFENLCNCIHSETEEYKNVQKAVELSKDILSSVNRAKKDAEDEQRLREIQQRLMVDKGDKSDPCINELKNLDFTKHKLIYEGPLSWRMTKGNKQKSDFYDVQAVLLNDMVVLLLRENDRFVLKMHTLNFAGKVDRVLARPIIKLHNLLHRPAAADKKAFFLLNTTSSNMNMYELWCSTTEERKLWLQHITKAADDYKNRQQESRRGEINPVTNIPPIVPEPDEKPKDVAEVADTTTTSVDGSGDAEQQGSGSESSGASPYKDASPASKNSINVNGAAAPESSASPVSSKNTPVSPNPSLRKGGFLRVTESAPLVDPSEVIVATRDVHFAQPVVSQYEELKRVDSTINKLFDEKQKLVSNILPIPPPGPDEFNHVLDNSVDSGPTKDAKDLVVACMHQVDQLGRILAGQKIPNDSLSLHREQFAIQKSLSNLLTQLLSEVQRRDDDMDLRRQELHRLREQNHGYHERLQSRSIKPEMQQTSSPAQLSSPTLSPSHSRPSSFLSVSSSSDHHDEEPEVVMKTPLKAQLSGHVASCSFSSSTEPLTQNTPCATVDASSSGPVLVQRVESDFFPTAPACDLAPEEFADAVEEVAISDVPLTTALLLMEANESLTGPLSTETGAGRQEPESDSQSKLSKNIANPTANAENEVVNAESTEETILSVNGNDDKVSAEK